MANRSKIELLQIGKRARRPRHCREYKSCQNYSTAMLPICSETEKRVSTDIVALTGLSLEAAEKISAIKRAGLSGQLSSLLEWNDFISLLRKVNSAIAFVAGMNLREYDPELYKASADEPERATEFFANISTPVRVDSKEYENQKLITDDLEISEAFSTDEYGDMMKARVIREFERYLDSTLVSLDLMLERQMKEAWQTSKNAATRPGG